MRPTPIITARATRPLSEIEFSAWVAQALPGDRLEYHRGFLVIDTFPTLSRLADAERSALIKLGSRAFSAAGQGLVHLLQKRLGPDQFAYLAIARPRPQPSDVSLSELLLSEQDAA